MSSDVDKIRNQIGIFGGLRREKGQKGQSFFNFDQDAPIKFRIYLFRQQFKEFSALK